MDSPSTLLRTQEKADLKYHEILEYYSYLTTHTSVPRVHLTPWLQIVTVSLESTETCSTHHLL